MPVGFGIGPGGSGRDPSAALRPPPLPPDQSQAQMAQDIHTLAERYVQPQGIDPQIIVALAANAVVKIDRSATPLNALVVTVSAGTFNIWFGDYSGSGQPGAPHLQIGAGFSNQYMLPYGPYVFTVQAVGIASSGCIIPMSI